MKKRLNMKAVKSFVEKTYSLIYVDYQDSFDNHLDLLQKCLKDQTADPIYEKISDWYLESELDSVDQIIKDLKDKCIHAGYAQYNVEEFFKLKDDAIRELIYNSCDADPVDQLLRNSSDVAVRIELYSNYDCINSHGLESSSGYSYQESYLKDMIDTLNLNPAKVKQLFCSNGVKVVGCFPDLKYRNGNELVTYEDFLSELVNTCCGENLLTFIGKICIKDLYDNNFKIDKITIPKNNPCGIFSSSQGGGSPFDMVLQKDFTLKLKKGRNKYTSYGFFLDKPSNYSITDTFGVTSDFFKNRITIFKNKK